MSDLAACRVKGCLQRAPMSQPDLPICLDHLEQLPTPMRRDLEDSANASPFNTSACKHARDRLREALSWLHAFATPRPSLTPDVVEEKT